MKVGSEHIVERHVLLDASEASVREAAAAVTVPRTWLMVFAEPRAVADWLPPGWQVDHAETGYLMAVGLGRTDPAPPAGYRVSDRTRDGVTVVEVRDAAGGCVARGQTAVWGDTAAMDRVVTEEAHRRRGLGSLVMRVLADRAAAAGATDGALGATPQGRALYEALGWQVRSILTECVYAP
ncbi:GNAT family N-acetyltransferase [Streptomyces sp. PU-14G]|uniref:GNAT family N-acetyltransferase n=1 Tax=Streptomyces sp. PU-14G TaxID=2800808 RepID=UPI0034DE7B94